MKRYDVISLITESSSVRGVFSTTTESSTQVFCEVRSVNRNEAYQSMAIGMNTSIVFILTCSEDYAGQKELIHNSVRYRVVRTFVSDDGIEIYCEVKNNG